MKFNGLFLASLMAATVWADSEEIYPVNFFAKLGHDMIALSMAPYPSTDKKVYVLSYEEPAIDPAKFILRGRYVRTNETNPPGFLGFHNDSLAIASFVNGVTWDIDGEGKVLNSPFYSCYCYWLANLKMYIVHGDIYGADTECYKVDIYILRPDKTVPPNLNRYEVIQSDTSIPSDTREIYPLFFYARLKKGTLIPLSASAVHFLESGSAAHLLSYGNKHGKPIKFTFKDFKVSTSDTDTPGDLGLYNGFMTISNFVNATTWNLDARNKVLNAPFYACNKFHNTRRYIRYGNVYKKDHDCFKVDVYLLRRDRSIGVNVRTLGMHSTPYPSKSISTRFKLPRLPQEFQDFHSKGVFPLVFFAEVKSGTFEPLSGIGVQLSINGKPEQLLGYQYPPYRPTQFAINNRKASTSETYISGYLEFDNGYLTVATTNDATLLDLDETSRLRNAPFYSCPHSDKNKRHIRYGYELQVNKGCFPVEIYLLKPDQMRPKDLRLLLGEKPKNKNQENQENENKNQENQENENQENKNQKNENQENQKTDTKNNFPSVHPNTLHEKDPKPDSSETNSDPLIFFAVFNGTEKPLSGLTSDTKNTKFLCYGNPKKAPVQFILKDGYVSTKSIFPEYIGSVDGLFVFGPTVPGKKLRFNSEKKLLGGSFHSCFMSYAKEYFIDEGESNCPKVDIYLKSYRSTEPVKIEEVHMGGKGHDSGLKSVSEKEIGKDVGGPDYSGTEFSGTESTGVKLKSGIESPGIELKPEEKSLPGKKPTGNELNGPEPAGLEPTSNESGTSGKGLTGESKLGSEPENEFKPGSKPIELGSTKLGSTGEKSRKSGNGNTEEKSGNENTEDGLKPGSTGEEPGNGTKAEGHSQKAEFHSSSSSALALNNDQNEHADNSSLSLRLALSFRIDWNGCRWPSITLLTSELE